MQDRFLSKFSDQGSNLSPPPYSPEKPDPQESDPLMPPPYSYETYKIEVNNEDRINNAETSEKKVTCDKKKNPERKGVEMLLVPTQMDSDSDYACPNCGSGPCFCVVVDVHNPLPDCCSCGSHDCGSHSCTGGGGSEGDCCCFAVVCGGAFFVLTTLGGAIYTAKELYHAFNQSKGYGMFKTAVASIGGVGGWLAAQELFSDYIAVAASGYVPPIVTKITVDLWSATMGAAVTTLVSSAVCKAPVSNHSSTLFGNKKHHKQSKNQYTPVSDDYDSDPEIKAGFGYCN